MRSSLFTLSAIGQLVLVRYIIDWILDLEDYFDYAKIGGNFKVQLESIFQNTKT